MVDVATVGMTAAVTGAVNILLWVAVQRSITRRDKHVDSLAERMAHLEERRLMHVEERLDGAAKARKDLHGEMDEVRVAIAELGGQLNAASQSFNTRLDSVMGSLGEVHRDIEKAVLDANQASRDVAKLIGRVDEIGRRTRSS